MAGIEIQQSNLEESMPEIAAMEIQATEILELVQENEPDMIRCILDGSPYRKRICNFIRLGDSGELLFHAAARLGDVDVMKAVMPDQDHTVHVKMEVGKRYTALHIAAANGRLSACRWLLTASSYVSQLNIEPVKIDELLDEDGNSPLHLAVLFRHKDVADLLVQKGASLSLLNNHFMTPISYCQSRDMFKILMKSPESSSKDAAEGALDINLNIRKVDATNRTVLHYAAIYSKNMTLLKNLIQVCRPQELNLHAIDRPPLEGTFLHEAARVGNVDALRAAYESLQEVALLQTLLCGETMENEPDHVCHSPAMDALFNGRTKFFDAIMQMASKLPLRITLNSIVERLKKDPLIKEPVQLEPNAANHPSNVAEDGLLRHVAEIVQELATNNVDAQQLPPPRVAEIVAEDGHLHDVAEIAAELATDNVDAQQLPPPRVAEIVAEDGHLHVVEIAAEPATGNVDTQQLPPPRVAEIVAEDGDLHVAEIAGELATDNVDDQQSPPPQVAEIVAEDGDLHVAEIAGEPAPRDMDMAQQALSHAIEVPLFTVLKDSTTSAGATVDLFASVLPTYLALYAKKKEVFYFMLESSVLTVNQWDDQFGRTCLHWAVLHNRPDIVRSMLTLHRKSAPPPTSSSTTEEDGWNPTAVISPTIKDLNGKTAFHLAFDQRNEEMMEIMRENSAFKAHEEKLFKDREVYVQGLNGILVGAALLVGVTFAGWLQLPSIDLESMTMKMFYVSNTVTFALAMVAICVTVRSLIPTPYKYVGAIRDQLRLDTVMAALLLAMSVVSAAFAFASAGFSSIDGVNDDYSKVNSSNSSRSVHSMFRIVTIVMGILGLIPFIFFLVHLYQCTEPFCDEIVKRMSFPGFIRSKLLQGCCCVRGRRRSSRKYRHTSHSELKKRRGTPLVHKLRCGEEEEEHVSHHHLTEMKTEHKSILMFPTPVTANNNEPHF